MQSHVTGEEAVKYSKRPVPVIYEHVLVLTEHEIEVVKALADAVVPAQWDANDVVVINDIRRLLRDV